MCQILVRLHSTYCISTALIRRSQIQLQCFERSEPIEICTGIIFNIFMGLLYISISDYVHVYGTCDMKDRCIGDVITSAKVMM